MAISVPFLAILPIGFLPGLTILQALVETTIVERMNYMIKLALFARFEAKPGKEKDVEAFLQKGLELANQEPTTMLWCALNLGPRVYGVFDAFADDSGRQKHLNGPIAQALMGCYPDLFVAPATIERIDLLGVKNTK